MAAIAQPARSPRLTTRGALRAVARSATGYELLLATLLGLMTAARLFLVPGYFRADTWLALAAGREVWNSGLPHHETLTALASGAQWVDQQWLSHLLTYGLYQVGGYGLIATLSVLLASGAFVLATGGALRLGARPRTVLLLMPVTAFPFFAQSWQPRTQMFAYPLFAAVFLLLLRDARKPSSRVLLVLPVLVLWANVHGSAVLGAALVVLRGVTLAAERRVWRIPAALVVLAPLALLATPYGAGTASYYGDTLLNGAFKELATEWQPVVHDPVLVAPFTALVVLGAWVLVRARAATTLWERLALVVLLAGAASAVRNMVWLTLGALPVLAVALDRRVGPGAAPSAQGMRLNRMLAVAAGLALVTGIATTLARPARDFERDYPQRYRSALMRAATADPGARIVADVGDADWLLWQEPSLRGRVAFDARLELLSAAGVHDIASVLRGSGPATQLGGGDGGYRIFALDRRSTAGAIQKLRLTPATRVAYADRTRAVLALPIDEARP